MQTFHERNRAKDYIYISNQNFEIKLLNCWIARFGSNDREWQHVALHDNVVQRAYVYMRAWRAYAFRVHILGGNDSRWTIRCYFLRRSQLSSCICDSTFTIPGENSSRENFAVLESQMAKGCRVNEIFFLEKRCRSLACERAAIDNRQVEKNTQVGGRGRRGGGIRGEDNGKSRKSGEETKIKVTIGILSPSIRSRFILRPSFIRGNVSWKLLPPPTRLLFTPRDALPWICIVTLFREETRPVCHALTRVRLLSSCLVRHARTKPIRLIRVNKRIVKQPE